MRILLTAVGAVLSLLFALPALALDDTPTQTPYLSSKADKAEDSRAAAVRAPAVPAATVRRPELDDGRRLQRAVVIQPAAAPTMVATTPAPLAPALSAVGRTPALASQAIGLR